MRTYRQMITLAAVLLVMAAGGYAAGSDPCGGNLQDTPVFQLRNNSPMNSSVCRMFYPESGRIRYEGDYVPGALSEPLPSGPVLPAGLESNPFVKPIEVEPVYYDENGQRVLANGQGILYDSEGCLLYMGSWKAGYRSGAGVEFFRDGRERYSGEYVQGLKQGPGRLYVLDNGVYYLAYEGSFEYECFHGQGTKFSPGGRPVFSGYWYYGEPQF